MCVCANTQNVKHNVKFRLLRYFNLLNREKKTEKRKQQEFPYDFIKVFFKMHTTYGHIAMFLQGSEYVQYGS